MHYKICPKVSVELWESYIVISRTRTPMRPHFHYGPIKWSHKMQFVFVADGGFVLSYAMPWLHFAINWQKIQNANYAITLGPNGRTGVALGRRMPPPPLWASQWDAGSFLNQNIANIFLDVWTLEKSCKKASMNWNTSSHYFLAHFFIQNGS